MKQIVYVLQHNVCNGGESDDDVIVYDSRELAREAMANYIEDSKRDSFWWDVERCCEYDDCIIDEDADSFFVFESGWCDEYHEEWKIVAREMVSHSSAGKKPSKGSEM